MQDTHLSTMIGHNMKDVSIRDILMPLFRRKRIVSLTFLVAILAAILTSLWFSHSYESHMAILVNRERLDPLVTTESTSQLINAPITPVTEEEINSEAELLKSSDVLQEVVIDNGLQQSEKRSFWGRFRTRSDDMQWISLAVRHLGKALKVDTLPKTNLISVTYVSGDPQIAYGVLNSLGTLYLAKHVTVHRPTGAYDFFAREADRYRKALWDSEARLAEFDKTEAAVAPDVQRTDLILVLTNSLASLNQAQEAAHAEQKRIDADIHQMQLTPKTSFAKEVSNSADILLQQLEGNLLSAQLRRTQLLVKFEPTYPLVQQVDQEIAQTKAAIEEAHKKKYRNETISRDPTFELLREDAAKANSDLVAQHATANALTHTIADIKSQLVTLDQKALRQADLKREVKTNEDSYLLYVSKREQERTADALDQKRIANVAIAVPPAMPVLPIFSPVSVLFFGLAAATVLSIGIGYAVEYADSSLHTPSEIMELLDIPVVISVPKQTPALGGEHLPLRRRLLGT